MGDCIEQTIKIKDEFSEPLTKLKDNLKESEDGTKKLTDKLSAFRKKSVESIEKVAKKTKEFAKNKSLESLKKGFKMGIDGVLELDEASMKIKNLAKSSLELKDIQNGLLDISNKTGKSFTELGDIQYKALEAGIGAEDSMAATLQASKLSVAGGTDGSTAVTAIGQVMTGFDIKGEENITAISDKLLVMQNLGYGTVAELGNSLNSIGPMAKNAGVGLDGVLASVGALTKSGMQSNDAMTSLESMMSNVIKPSAQAKEEAKRLGIDFSAAGIEAKGFGTWLEELKEKTNGSSESLEKLFGSSDALKGAMALTGDGFKEFGATMEAVKNSTGATEEAYGDMTNTIGFKIDKLKNTAKVAFTKMMNTQSGEIGKALDAVTGWLEKNQGNIDKFINFLGNGISKVIQFIKKVFNFIKKHKTIISGVLVFIGVVYSAIKVVKLLKYAFEAISMIAGMSPIILIIAAVVTAVYLLYKNWDKISKFIKKGIELVKLKFGELLAYIKGVFLKVWDSTWGNISKGINIVKEAIQTWWSNLKSKFGEVIGFIKDTFLTKWNFIWDTISKAFSIVTEKISTWWETLKLKFGEVISFFQDIFLTAWNFIWDTVVGVFTKITEIISFWWEGLKFVFGEVISFFQDFFLNTWNLIWDTVAGVFSKITEKIGIWWEALKGTFSSILEFFDIDFAERWGGIWTRVVDKFAEIFGGIKEKAKSPLNAVIEFINDAIRGLNTMKVPDWVPKLGGKGVSIPLIPRLAKGTNSWRGGIVQVHEEGGEIIDLPRGSRVYPHDKSVNMARAQGKRDGLVNLDSQKINVIIQGNVIGNNEFIDQMGKELYRQVKLAKSNS